MAQTSPWYITEIATRASESCDTKSVTVPLGSRWNLSSYSESGSMTSPNASSSKNRRHYGIEFGCFPGAAFNALILNKCKRIASNQARIIGFLQISPCVADWTINLDV
ncbi:hypothetical protein NL676_035325 [Syzygium grande]|nr:hypothetical protein NL676_035325 [Syzygium grande]